MILTLPTKKYIEQKKCEQEWAKEKLETEINDVMMLIDVIEDNFDISSMFADQNAGLTEFRNNLLNIMRNRCYNPDDSVKQNYVEILKEKYNDDYESINAFTDKF